MQKRDSSTRIAAIQAARGRAVRMPQDRKAKQVTKTREVPTGKHARPYSEKREAKTLVPGYVGKHEYLTADERGLDPAKVVLDSKRSWVQSQGVVLVGQALDEVDRWEGYFVADDEEAEQRAEAEFIDWLKALNEEDGYVALLSDKLGAVEVSA